MKGQFFYFCHPTVVGGRRPLPPKIADRIDPPPSKIAHVDRFPPVTSQQQELAKKTSIIIVVKFEEINLKFEKVRDPHVITIVIGRHSVVLIL